MTIDYTPSVFLLLAGLPLAFYLLRYVWRDRSRPGALPFVVIIGLSSTWTIEAAFELLAADLPTKLFWANLQYLQISFLPVACLVLAVDYTGKTAWLTRRNLFALSVIPLITVALVWTNSFHHLMRTNVWLDTTQGHAVIGRTFGLWFWVNVVYSYLVLFAAFALLLHAVLSRPGHYRKQPAILFAGLAAPVLWNAFYLLNPGVLPTFDYTPAVFAVGELIGAWGLFRLGVFSLVTVARDSLIENMSDGLLVLDEQSRVADLNEAARALIGPVATGIVGRPIADVWPTWGRLAALSWVGSERATLSVGSGDERRDYDVNISPVSGRGFHGRLLAIRDVTERSVLEDALRQQALTDSLTGLANRTLFMSKLNDAVHLALRHPDRIFAAIILDVDRFKQINDTVGHAAGDAVLESIAVRLKRIVREVDTVGRLGGDEFMILLEDIDSIRDVIVILERIQEGLRAPVAFKQQKLQASASVGVVVWDGSFHDPEDLLHAADAAMYQAKEAGGACYRVFDERMNQRLLEALHAESELRAAIEDGDFALVYQPVIEVKSNKVVALEALVRWEHPERGTIRPDAFIGIAENSGLILPLGEMILDQVCSRLSEWRAYGPVFDVPVSLNISPRQLTDAAFVDAVLTRVADWRLPPGSLVFEVTEQAIDRDPLRARAAIDELCSLGMQVCLDDFGAGASSLQQLAGFPGQEVKIDRRLVAKAIMGTAESAVVKSIIDLAHALELVVTAEGVESERHRELLEAAGCDRVQGYYCGQPMAAPALLEYLDERGAAQDGVSVRRTLWGS